MSDTRGVRLNRRGGGSLECRSSTAEPLLFSPIRHVMCCPGNYDYVTKSHDIMMFRQRCEAAVVNLELICNKIMPGSKR